MFSESHMATYFKITCHNVLLYSVNRTQIHTQSFIYSFNNKSIDGQAMNRFLGQFLFSNAISLSLPQAHEAVIRGQYPAPEETLQFLAALRLQYLLGDYTTQSVLPELEQVFPMARLRARVQQSARCFASATPSTDRKRGSFLEGTLRRSFRGSLGRQRQEEEPAAIEAWLQDEKAGLRSCLVEKWRKLQGMEQEQALKKYMSLIKEWQGYGSTLFDVEVRTHTHLSL